MWYLKATSLPSDLMAECSSVANKNQLIKCLKKHESPSIYDELIEVIEEKIAAQKGSIEEDQKLLALPEMALSPQKRVMITARMHHKMILRHNLKLANKLAGNTEQTKSDEL